MDEHCHTTGCQLHQGHSPPCRLYKKSLPSTDERQQRIADIRRRRSRYRHTPVDVDYLLDDNKMLERVISMMDLATPSYELLDRVDDRGLSYYECAECRQIALFDDAFKHREDCRFYFDGRIHESWEIANREAISEVHAAIKSVEVI